MRGAHDAEPVRGAGNAAGLNDGAGCVLLASHTAAEELGLRTQMRLVDYTFVGVEPETMGWDPTPATEELLQRIGLSIDKFDVVELNEAFAVQCVASRRPAARGRGVPLHRGEEGDVSDHVDV